MMLHAYVGYLRSLWADCWDYDKISITELDEHYDAYHAYCDESESSNDCPYNLGLDDPFEVYELKDAKWSLANSEDITVRKMWNPSDMNIVYELGPFFKTSATNTWCENNLNSEWFIETMDYDVDSVNTPVNELSAHL